MEIITQRDKDQLLEKLDTLKANRPVITKRIAEARELGDLKENAEYHAAREQQGLEEAEIRRLEDRLGSVQVVSENMSTDVVFLGSTVKLREHKTGDEDLYKLVGEMSDDIPDDYAEVTASSPMGEALMKARVGEQIRVKTPRGVKVFDVVEIV